MRTPNELETLAVDAQQVRRAAWPFYVVFDVSKSMWDPVRWRGHRSPYEIMNDSLSLIVDSLTSNFDAASFGRLGIIAFAQDAWETHALEHIKEIRSLEQLPQGEWTNYVAAWKLLAQVLPRDVQRLKSENLSVLQPVVFFITDGNAGALDRPQLIEEWKPLHDELCATDFHERPRIVALGMGDVNRECVLAIRSLDPPGPACLASPGESATTLLTSIINMIIHSIKHSSSTGTFDFEIPDGMTRLDEG